MPLHFSTFGFNDAIVHALSWTLLHSLWQGMLLAMVAGIIIFFTKKSSAAARYNLLTAALLIFITGIFITLFLELAANRSTEVATAEQTGTFLTTGPANLVPAGVGNSTSLAAGATSIFNANAGWIVVFWVAIILLKCCRLITGLYGVYRLKTRQTFSAGEHWNHRLADLSRQLRIKKNVRLLQSGIGRIPSVIGFFKPVILFPAGMLAALPPNEVEAILIHELAHIRRGDFLVNMVQHVVEIIFFFNPAIRWVSGLIRCERENCCDDIAVNQTENKRNYINALVSFQGFGLSQETSLANAFGAKKDHLINRVKRIIYNNNKTLNNMEKKFLVAGMMITSVFIFAFSSDGSRQSVTAARHITLQNAFVPGEDKNVPGAIAICDTVPDKATSRTNNLNGIINTVQNGKKYKMVTENGVITELYADGKKVPADKIAGYKPLTDKILKQMQLDREQAEIDMKSAEKDMAEAKISQEENEKSMMQAKLELEKAQEAMEQDMKAAREEMMEQNGKETEERKAEMEESKKEMEEAKLEMQRSKKEAEEDMKEAGVRMEELKKEMAVSKAAMLQAREDMEQSKKDMIASQKDMADAKKVQDGMIADFIKENIIKNKNELTSFMLNNKELIVNGVKQPDAIYKRISAKYVKSGNWTMKYNYNDDNDENVK